MRFQRLLIILTTLFFPLNTGTANDLAKEAAMRIEQELPKLRLSPNDFKISSGWELPLVIPIVESFFSQPLDVPRTGSRWADKMENAKTMQGLYSVATDILQNESLPVSNATVSVKAKQLQKIPSEIKPAIETLLNAIATAQPLLKTAVDSVPASSRTGFLSLCEWPAKNSGSIEQDISSRRTKKKYSDMTAFSQDHLLAAGEVLFRAMDEALPLLQREAIVSLRRKVRVHTEVGVVLIGSPLDDHYRESELKDVVLLIDMGGNNTYQAPVARALENEIRIVIDLGADVTVQAEQYPHGSAGTGAFGIGILVLPNEKGEKNIRSGSFSQGCGVAGIGALFINGTAKLTAERNTQGAGFFGVGILSTEKSPNSTFVAKRTGQGSAQVRGVGLFRHEGDNADVQGGLVQPDPREPQGSISMCQGVGFGHRAYSGGGVGLAVLHGDKISVKGSYFSQGTGYWHAFGGFRIRGNENLVQARRYDMGSGVHSAFGHFEILGDYNRILNWGVGPAYGWDRSVGSAIVAGDNNEVQVDWGAGVGNIGSVSMGYYKTNNGRFKLCDFARGQFYRNESSYSVQILEGEKNQLQCVGEDSAVSNTLRLLRNPRGLAVFHGVELVNDLNLKPAVWPELPQDKAIQDARVDLQSIVKHSKTKAPLDELADLIDVAAAFSLDKKTPRDALGVLLSQPEEKAALFPELLDPAAIDQLIQLSVILPAHGDAVSKAVFQNLSNYTLQKQTVLIHFLRLFRPSVVFPNLRPLLQSPDNKIRAATLRTFGYMLNKDTGNEPGLRSTMDALAAMDDKAANELLKKMVLSDAFALLSICHENNSGPDRLKFLKEAPADVTSPIGDKGAAEFLQIVRSDNIRNQMRITSEIKVLDDMTPLIRAAAVEILKSTQTSDITSGLLALGQIADPSDAALLPAFFGHNAASVRETAATALGRMGDSALPYLNDVLTTGDVRERCLAVVTLQQSVSKKTLPLLKKGLNDPSSLVRMTAIGVTNELSDLMALDKAAIRILVQNRLREEKDDQVKRSLRLAATALK